MFSGTPDRDMFTVSASGTSFSSEQLAALDEYEIRVKRERITPRHWLKDRPGLSDSERLRQQLWYHYWQAYPPPLVPGYVLQEILGEGGMGQVFLGKDEKLDRLTAIKEITSELSRDPHFQERFRFEAKALAKLNHPNIVQVYQFISRDGREFIAMEYASQGSLADRTVPDESEGFSATIGLMAKLARAIGSAHHESIIHRDLKPANILFDAKKEPKISDFGLAKYLLDPANRSGGRLLGTPAYMAPEQTMGQSPVPGTDIWALGVIMYLRLTGQLPFNGKDRDELFHNIRTATPRDMGSDVPTALREICLQCLAKVPEHRYSSGEELARALESLDAPRLRKPLPPMGRRPEWWLAGATAILVISALIWLTASARRVRSPVPEMMNDRHIGQCASLAFLPDGLRAVSEDGGGRIVLWDLQRRGISATTPHDSQQPRDDFSGIVAVASGAGLIASAGVPANDYMLIPQLYNSESGLKLIGPIATFGRVGRLGRAMALSPDGTKLGAVDLPNIVNELFGSLPFIGPGNIRLWVIDVKSGKGESHQLESEVRGLAFSPDGNFLITCSNENYLALWNLDKSGEAKKIPAHPGGADQVAFSADGRRIFTASSADDSLRILNNDGDRVEIKSVSLASITSKMLCCAFFAGRTRHHRSRGWRRWYLGYGNRQYLVLLPARRSSGHCSRHFTRRKSCLGGSIRP